MYQKLWLDDVQFLRTGVWQMDGQMDGQTDGRKKWHIEVGAPPKKETPNFGLGHVVWILFLNAWHVLYAFTYIFCNYYHIVFGYLGLCSRTKLKLRDAASEMKLSFQVLGSWIWRSPFVCSKTISIKLSKKYISLFILLQTRFTKLKWLTRNTYAHWYVSLTDMFWHPPQA